MILQHVRVALLAGGIVAATALTARADDCCSPAPCAPQYRTVCVNEWVPENYQCTRTVYTKECKQETYTAYRCECVPETRTRTCTTYRMVPEVQTVVRKVCVCVPTVEERTVMQTHVTCKPVTHMTRRCVDKGHYECREVPCGPSWKERFHRCFHRRHHGCDSCCEDSCEPCCVRTRTERCWVPCPTWEEVPVTCYERVCESRPVTCKVTVYKNEIREEKCQVTCCKCVPETHTETYTCTVHKLVPYQATRSVVHCVPHQETVICCRMVCRTVQKQVPCETSCCSTSCCENSCCESGCCRSHGHHRLCSGLSFRSHGHHGCCD